VIDEGRTHVKTVALMLLAACGGTVVAPAPSNHVASNPCVAAATRVHTCADDASLGLFGDDPSRGDHVQALTDRASGWMGDGDRCGEAFAATFADPHPLDAITDAATCAEVGRALVAGGYQRESAVEMCAEILQAAAGCNRDLIDVSYQDADTARARCQTWHDGDYFEDSSLRPVDVEPYPGWDKKPAVLRAARAGCDALEPAWKDDAMFEPAPDSGD
jgi:hypothetical protein